MAISSIALQFGTFFDVEHRFRLRWLAAIGSKIHLTYTPRSSTLEASIVHCHSTTVVTKTVEEEGIASIYYNNDIAGDMEIMHMIVFTKSQSIFFYRSTQHL